MTTLNQGQQAAADAFFQFLFSKDKEFIISGPAGVGKTFLMSHMIDKILPQYEDTCQLMGIEPEFKEVVMTATTNKAAEVLAVATNRPTSTIHSFLGLKVQNDFKTGRQKLTKTNRWKVHENMVLFVDEGFMIDSDLYFMIHGGTQNCKIVYVGDHCQMAPIMELISPIARNNILFTELTEPVRNAEQPALMAVCNQLRDTVETGQFQPIQIVPGVIDHMDGPTLEAELNKIFIDYHPSARVLTYTNNRVIEFNNAIRDIRQAPPHPFVGETMVNNSGIPLAGAMLAAEEEVLITRIDQTSTMVSIEQDVDLEVRSADLHSSRSGRIQNVRIPMDMDHFRDLVKYYGRKKDFEKMFFLKDGFPDLRPRDAATVYKAQGSTYDTVIVDVGNISECNNPSQVARMLYVALSRARKRIILFGDLAQKYGGLAH